MNFRFQGDPAGFAKHDDGSDDAEDAEEVEEGAFGHTPSRLRAYSRGEAREERKRALSRSLRSGTPPKGGGGVGKTSDMTSFLRTANNRNIAASNIISILSIASSPAGVAVCGSSTWLAKACSDVTGLSLEASCRKSACASRCFGVSTGFSVPNTLSKFQPAGRFNGTSARVSFSIGGALG